MRRKKALIFPYDISCVHMIINRNMILEYEISHVVSLKSWGYCDKDAGAHLKVHTGVNVSDDFETALAKVDTVIITDTIIPLDNSLMQMYRERAIHAGKEVLDSRSFAEKPFAYKNSLADGGIPQINDIDKPLVVVVGTGTNTGKFDTQLYVRKIFLDEGYKVSQIGSKPNCNLWGFHGFPQFMIGKNSGAEKILMFNQYVNYIASAEDPDIIIIGVPGGIVPISNKVYDDFGLMNYMVSNAVKPDYVILNTGFVDYNKSYIETMTEAVKNRFDYEVDSVFLSNFCINWEVTDVLDRLVYMTLPLDVVNQDANECGCYSLYCEEDVDCFKKNMLSTLEGYSSIDVM